MERKIYYPIIIQRLDALTCFLTFATLMIVASALQQQQPLQSGPAEGSHPSGHQEHPSLLVDTKYWMRNTEFGERDNWRNQLKPCTMLERIRISEQAVVSMGDSLDEINGALESINIRHLELPTNGMLLLEEDSPADPIDMAFIKYLNESGNCYETSSAADDDLFFQFEPPSDEMSWFNPDNWFSTLNEADIIDWIPDSHRIPCAEDVAVFGSHRVALPLGNERSKVMSFKVNFRPSEYMQSDLANLNVSSVRVSKLRIGDQAYNQEDFEQLVQSPTYKNLLFQFDDSLSPLQRQETTGAPPLIIDESSIQSGTEQDLCLDEAGCLCGNEDVDVMKLICSFHEPIEPEEMACFDPITSVGYCNKICASSLTLLMDPSKFNERYIVQTLQRLLTDVQTNEYFAENVFTATRRTHFNRYEITFRHVPSERKGYAETVGREREFAQLVHRVLDKEATRSFYGIKSITLTSSVQWRSGNRTSVFWVSLLITVTIASLMYVSKDSGYVGGLERATRLGDTPTFASLPSSTIPSDQQQDTLVHYQGSVNQETEETSSRTESTAESADLCSQEIQLVDLDAESRMDSDRLKLLL